MVCFISKDISYEEMKREGFKTSHILSAQCQTQQNERCLSCSQMFVWCLERNLSEDEHLENTRNKLPPISAAEMSRDSRVTEQMWQILVPSIAVTGDTRTALSLSMAGWTKGKAKHNCIFSSHFLPRALALIA